MKQSRFPFHLQHITVMQITMIQETLDQTTVSLDKSRVDCADLYTVRINGELVTESRFYDEAIDFYACTVRNARWHYERTPANVGF